MIKTKSVLSHRNPRTDGLRILVARFRGRGMPKSSYDVWMPNLGPTETLLRNFLGGRVAWNEFSRRYRQELFDSAEADRDNKTIKNHGQKFTLRLLQHVARKKTVTLLCHCAEDALHCHRHVLRKVLEGKI